MDLTAPAHADGSGFRDAAVQGGGPGLPPSGPAGVQGSSWRPEQIAEDGLQGRGQLRGRTAQPGRGGGPGLPPVGLDRDLCCL